MIKKYLYLACGILALSACSGGSNGSSNNTKTSGSATIGSTATLSVKPGVIASVAIPLYNNGTADISIGTGSITSNSGDISFTSQNCLIKNTTGVLHKGDVCYIVATYKGSSQTTGLQKTSYSIPINSTDNTQTKVSGTLSYQTLDSSYNKQFIAQSIDPIVLQDNANQLYTSIYIYNSESSTMNFSESTGLAITKKSGNGSLSIVDSNCYDITNSSGKFTLPANNGCYVILLYSQATSTSTKLKSLAASNGIATFNIKANDSVNLDLTLQNSTNNDAQGIINDVGTINMLESTAAVVIQNSGDLPITSLNASPDNTSFSVNYSSCTQELPISPGSDSCDIVISKKLGSNPTGNATLTIKYKDENDTTDKVLTSPINYSGIILSSFNKFNTKVNLAESQYIIITNNNASYSYVGNSISNLNKDFSINDNDCVGKTLNKNDSCTAILTYKPTTVVSNQQGTMSFNLSNNGTTTTVFATVNYSSYNPVAAITYMYGDVNISSVTLSTAVDSSDNQTITIKNTGTAAATNLSNILGSVSGLTQSTTCGNSLDIGASCTITLNYTSVVTTNSNTTLTTSYDGGSASLLINYTSSDSRTVKIIYCQDNSCSSQLSSLALTSQVGTAKQSYIYVKNTGNTNATNVTYTVAESIGITILNNSCSSTLMANAVTACQISLQYLPTSTASGSTSFNINYKTPQGNATVSSLPINYNATTTLPASLIYCSDASCSTTINNLSLTTSQGKTITKTIYIKNTGDVATGNLTSAFSTTSSVTVTNNTCSSGVSNANICSITFSFTPASSTDTGGTTYELTTSMESVFSLPITYTTVAPSGKVLSIFWCGFNGSYCGQSVVDSAGGNWNGIDDVNPKATHVILAFANSSSSGDGSVTVNTEYWPTDLIKSWQASGKKVIISVGGQNGNWSDIFADDTHIATFINSVKNIINTYGIDGIDLDIENYAATPHTVATTIKNLRVALGPNKQIIVSPEVTTVYYGLAIPSANTANTDWNYFVPVLNEAIDDIDYVQPQYYNNNIYNLPNGSSSFLINGYQTWLGIALNPAPDAWTVPFASGLYVGVPPEKLIMGVLASNSAGGSAYYTTPDNLTAAISTLNQVPASQVGGVMMWDSHWDKLNNYVISDASASALGL